MPGCTGPRWKTWSSRGRWTPRKVVRLLKAMQARAREVKPEALGVIGQAHVTQMLTDAYGVDPDTLTYRCHKGVVDGLPYILEVACGWNHTLRTARGGGSMAITMRRPSAHRFRN